MPLSAAVALQRYTDAFARRDPDGVADLFAENCLCEIPLVGRTLASREEIRERIRIDLGGIDHIQVSWSSVIENGSMAYAEGSFRAYVLGGFEWIDFPLVAVVVVEGEHVVRLSEYFDTRPVRPSERMKVHAPPTRRSPYWDRANEAGQMWFIVYNHTYFPLQFRNTPYEDYVALTERVTLWDVGCERQTELRGPDAVRLTDYLCARDMTQLEVGMCRYAPVCTPDGQILNDPVVLRPWEDVVWISHGDVDMTLWAQGIALGKGFDCELSEPDVAPVQVQGPKSPEVLRPLVEGDLDGLGFYRCMPTKVAGIDAVVSRTGWSGGLGYEVYPLGSERALELWDAILEAGEPHGIEVTGANVHRAIERGVTDLAWWTNCDMTPFEAGLGKMIDLDGGDFIGKEALKRASEAGESRRTVGLVYDAEVPRAETFWPLRDARGGEGTVRWSNYSFARSAYVAIALVDGAVDVGESVTVEHPEGAVTAQVVELPFAD
jgi:glycine cleavage system aminomethyltransferase T